MKTNALLFSLILITSSLAGCFGDSDESEEQDIDSIIQEIDSDNDGILNSVDLCPDTADDERQMVDSSGCYDEDSYLDSDNDGVANNKDECQDSPETEPVFLNGCSITQLDFDKDGVIDTLDQCPNTSPNVATLPNGCLEGEVPNSVAVRITPEPNQNYKFAKPENSVVFAFNVAHNVDENNNNDGQKYTTNIGPFTADENNQLVIGTILNDEFKSPGDGHLMIHYTSEQLIENIPEYIATLDDEVDGGYGGLYYNSIEGDEFLNYSLEYYIWAIPQGENDSFYGSSPTNNSLVGIEVCDQPPAYETTYSMPDGDIQNLSLYDFTGKVIVLEIGAEWCGPCQEVLQELKELNSMAPFRNKIQFLSMSMQNNDWEDMSVEEAQARQIAEGINFPVSGTNELGQAFDRTGIPIILIFTIDPSRDLNLVTVSKTVGLPGLDLFDTLVEVDRLFSGEYAAELCHSYQKADDSQQFYDTDDYDGDGVKNYDDMFPEDPEEQYDLDEDGIGDNADLDDDNDGISDDIDLCPQTNMKHYNEWISIIYADGCADLDGDQYNSTIDCNDYNPIIKFDSDGDGYCDQNDEFPNDITEWRDSDNDGVGDNSDKYPETRRWQNDTDGDGIPDGDSWDWDEDGIIDEWEEGSDICPNTPSGVQIGEDGCEDSDDDGFSYKYDCDDNNSEISPGVLEIEDSIDNNCNGYIDEGFFPPVVNSVEITDGIGLYQDYLVCNYNFSVDDSFWVITNLWAVNGIVVVMNNAYLNPLFFTKGDFVSCGVNVEDGWGLTGSGFDRMVVANRLPEVSDIFVNQLNNGTIVCEIGESNDLDGDDITFSYQWFIDGELSTVTNSYLMSSDYTFSEGDDVTCIVTPHDGEEEGSSASKTITMEIMVEEEQD